VPNGFHGKVQVKVKLDLGPIEVKMEEAWATLE
jgi:hypothetical protein